ncbi:putative Ubiquitin C-terminal hydrolase 3 [Monocercomonoides exilis]|uniref:putative Ubiquitin C-terminal hydrolase 3 n=1 Tax=Monocercomonoides exilis TaxID=2049356 RepID=UPI00355A569C|nr:putative Ubiquitin C-terminal hydrolase 3 [Monocercomonoides exilis]|eukprot:MONOS_5430.1-p1 / transcript=MONOS_5430.1 / gene=MONOS_5430 / organism=Monocercomonoides_exilis_PA203 / gene_product=Ubiquitin C-terminal hydrolase 3 / transcript_product=Ubiquitin C-terminal hydrolase 3 / location=Mono_scaffold00157:96150-97524(-) / protein_length=307 / sequence_SO=supercontig / SO=protein_coding / is_pseudo=false
MSWLPLESNPDVLNDYMHSLGLSHRHICVDVLGFEDELLAFVPQPVHAIFLLYPWDGVNFNPDTLSKDSSILFVDQDPEIGQACGTIAVLNALGSKEESLKFREDSFFTRFFERMKNVPAGQRGKEVMKDKELENSHSNAAKEGQTAPPNEDEFVTTHFISFIEKNGRLIQLDGLKPGPVDLGACPKDGLLNSSVKEIQKMIEKSKDQTNFGIIALVDNEDYQPEDDEKEKEKEKEKEREEEEEGEGEGEGEEEEEEEEEKEEENKDNNDNESTKDKIEGEKSSSIQASKTFEKEDDEEQEDLAPDH